MSQQYVRVTLLTQHAMSTAAVIQAAPKMIDVLLAHAVTNACKFLNQMCVLYMRAGLYRAVVYVL